MKEQKGITLIALVVTIIVLLVLSSVSISILTGDNGIISRAKIAKEAVRGSEIKETVNLEALSNKTYKELQQNKRKSRDQVINELYLDGHLSEEEVDFLEEHDVISIGEIEIDFSVLGGKTLGDVYTDDMIGQEITYSSNGQTEWIVFGKDSEGNILITTKNPIQNGFTVSAGPEAWLKYESYTDSRYGLNYACSNYGGRIQDLDVKSRSIKMEDIDYVVGLEAKNITLEGKTYNIQSFDNVVFGLTKDIENNKLDFSYPNLNGNNTFWKKPSRENEKTMLYNPYRIWICSTGKYILLSWI